MKKSGLLGLALLVLLTVVAMALPAAASASTHDYYRIYAGRDKQTVGYLGVWTEGETLVVDYVLYFGWLLEETHLAVADDLSGIPLTRSGNPKIGQFAIFGDNSGMTFDPPVSRYTYRHHIDGTLPIYLSAHAVVYNPDTCQQETAFANCEKTVPFHQVGVGGRWGWWFEYPWPGQAT